MNIDEFTHPSNDTRWFYHQRLPLIICNINGSKVYWFYPEKTGYTHMHELSGRQIEDVSEEEISLYILKYSI